MQAVGRPVLHSIRGRVLTTAQMLLAARAGIMIIGGLGWHPCRSREAGAPSTSQGRGVSIFNPVKSSSWRDQRVRPIDGVRVLAEEGARVTAPPDRDARSAARRRMVSGEHRRKDGRVDGGLVPGTAPGLPARRPALVVRRLRRRARYRGFGPLQILVQPTAARAAGRDLRLDGSVTFVDLADGRAV